MCLPSSFFSMDHVEENESPSNGRAHEDDYTQKFVFAVGATLAMACLKSILVMFFVKQWPARVFLILNIVLLAIFFTSLRSSSSENQETRCNAEVNIQENKRRKQCGWSATAKANSECQEMGKRERVAEEIEQAIRVESEDQKLSKEELNERVEAFIAMFRQHLVSDARNCRSQFLSRPKQS
ncbi:uncharacterized protein LOC110605668 [Manihot esculenta]|uniref:Uncharacterized protein n=2 Tax=Manihot esculenta TaxID=3983 RepID=A0ACB7G4S7_MANES|nr:uncharacterized protein LOC110605668 [Manihot esculenta]KAG8635085.1 hypothetical protein MANES_17G117500v8 [Manihot esculenta]